MRATAKEETTKDTTIVMEKTAIVERQLLRVQDMRRLRRDFKNLKGSLPKLKRRVHFLARAPANATANKPSRFAWGQK